MPKFSRASIEKLNTCHPDLIRLFTEVIKHYDCTIICGQRGQKEQDEAFHAGKSKLVWPNSKHNARPSLAVDVSPYPIDWSDGQRFVHFAGFVQGVAQGLGIKIRWGGDWDSDNDLKDQTFFDLPHFELDVQYP